MTQTDIDIALSGAPFKHLIDGRIEDSETRFDVLNPATEEAFATCPDASREQLDRAIAAARRAQKDWAATSLDTRRELIGRLSDALRDHGDEIKRLIVLEQGKTFAQADFEVNRAADAMDEIAAIRFEPQVLRESETERVDLIYKPLGVIACITPWNAPVVLASPKIASALLAGNAAILKPAPTTPLATLRLGEIWADLVPAGLVNVLAGGNDLGQWMGEHPGVNKISFTGSVATGRRVMETASRNLKRVTLELGGNDAAIVLDDADLDTAIPGLFAGAFTLAGQVCMGIKRLYVQRGIYEQVVERMVAAAEATVLGSGFDDGVTLGPVQNRMQFERVLGLIEDTRLQPGVDIRTGGFAPDRPGYFIAPTIVTGATEDMRIVREEQFGPVLPILAFDTIDEAVERANNTNFGLGGSVWSRDVAHATEIVSRLEAGYTWVNWHQGTTRDLPFGGVKESGIGRQGHFIGVSSDMEPQVIIVSKTKTAA